MSTVKMYKTLIKTSSMRFNCIFLALLFPICADADGTGAGYDLDVIKSMGGDEYLFDVLTSGSLLNELDVNVYVNGNSIGNFVIKYTADFNVIIADDMLKKMNDILLYDEIEDKELIDFDLNVFTHSLKIYIPKDLMEKYNLRTTLNAFVINYGFNSAYTSDYHINGQFSSKLLFNGYAFKNDFNLYNKEFTRTSTYLEKLFKNKNKLLIGETSLQSSVFDGMSFVGAQITPKIKATRLTNKSSDIIYYAQTPSVVEIYQGSNILYSKDVPVGEFTLPKLDLDSNEEAHIRVIGSDGRIIRYPYYISQTLSGSSDDWFSVAFGGVKGKDNYFATASYGSNLYNINYSVGVLGAKDHLNLGLISSFTESIITVSGSVLTSLTNKFKYKSGISTNINIDYFTIMLNYYKGNGYDNILIESNPYQRMNVSLMGRLIKNVNYNVGWGRDMHNEADRYYFRINTYNKSFSTSWLYEMANEDKSVSIELSIPLFKKGSFSSSINRRRYRTSANIRYNMRVSDDFNYNLGYGHDTSNNYNIRMQGYYKTDLMNMSSSVNKFNKSTSYNMSLSGSSVITRNGVHFSPYRASDTFSLARIKGDNISLKHTKGNAFTSKDKMVLINLKPYELNNVSIANKNDLGNVRNQLTNKIDAKYGQVYSTKFEFKDESNSIYQVTINNEYPAFGSIITGLNGEFSGVIGVDGIFLLEEKRRMIRVIDGHSSCEILLPLTQGMNIHKIDVTC